MHYYKNIELTKLYPVSEKAVRNWIDSALKGKSTLQLVENGGKQYIANTTQNQRIIQELIERGKKYKNSLGFKQVEPRADFYKIFSQQQILDIISNIEVHQEIPYKYSYFNGGAHVWDKYSARLEQEDGHNTLKDTIELLTDNLPNIDRFIGARKRVNVIDLGVGNGRPLKELLAHLKKRGVLHRYIGVDISKEMLDIAERNVTDWFNGEIKLEKHFCDLDFDRFNDVIAADQLNDDEPPMNLLLLLGGTHSNARTPRDIMRTIYNSMGANDLLIQSRRIDSDKHRTYFDFNIDGQVQALDPQARMLTDILGIDPSLYDVENKYDPESKMRKIQVRMKVATIVNFKVGKGARTVELQKGSTLLLWRARHMTLLDIINEFAGSGFRMINGSLDKERSYFLSISDIMGEN